MRSETNPCNCAACQEVRAHRGEPVDGLIVSAQRAERRISAFGLIIFGAVLGFAFHVWLEGIS